MSKNPPTRYVELSDAELFKLGYLIDRGYSIERTRTGNKTRLTVRKPRRNKR